ncbi:MAG: G8 domain-containing protein [Burkholderiaceae bacterium]
MRKFTAVFALATIACSALVSCGGSSEGGAAQPTSNGAAAPTPTASPGPSTTPPPPTPTPTPTATPVTGVLPAAPPPLTSAGALKWSDPATWGGTLPGADAVVVIPAGRTIVMDVDVKVRSLRVEGALLFADKDLTLRSNWIAVAGGRLQAGTREAPRMNKLVIELDAADQAEDVLGMGTKFLGVFGNGAIELHGAPRTSWSKLNGTALAGADRMTVLDAAGWKAGDQIIVAPTDFEPAETETRTIKSISGNTLVLDAPLRHQHWGSIEELATTGQSMDMRAPVGLLTRNITIRGSTPQDGKFGAHVMAMDSALLQLAGVEITGAGQRGKLGRYPLHWHLSGNAGERSYVVDSAIHTNFQRGVVIHRTNGVLMRNTVVADSFGHLVFLESSNEVRNTFDGNLVMHTRPYPPADMNPEIGFDHQCGCHVSNGNSPYGRTSGFWISNAYNTLVNNHVAAINHGNGYWYAEAFLHPQRDADLTSPGRGQPVPSLRNHLAMGTFRDNTAQTIKADSRYYRANFMNVAGSALFIDRIPYDKESVFDGLRMWKIAHSGVWGASETPNRYHDSLPTQVLAPQITRLVSADARAALNNGMGAQPTLRVRNSVLYAFTANQPAGRDPNTFDWKTFLNNNGNDSDDLHWNAAQTYPSFNLVANDAKPVPEASMTKIGINANMQQYSEFKDVIVKGYPYVEPR